MRAYCLHGCVYGIWDRWIVWKKENESAILNLWQIAVVSRSTPIHINPDQPDPNIINHGLRKAFILALLIHLTSLVPPAP